MRVGIITGAFGGIATAVAEKLSANGTTLCGLDLHVPPTIPTVYDAASTCDVTSWEQISTTMNTICDKYSHIDIVVTTAGLTWRGPLEEMPVEEWNRLVQTNLSGVFYCCKAVIPVMKRQRQGCIINVGSAAGLVAGFARPWEDPETIFQFGGACYSSTKAAVHVLSACLAKGVALYGIRVNAVAPGPTATSMIPAAQANKAARLIPIDRVAQASEIADAVTFLASPDASYITGTTLNISGGLAPL